MILAQQVRHPMLVVAHPQRGGEKEIGAPLSSLVTLQIAITSANKWIAIKTSWTTVAALVVLPELVMILLWNVAEVEGQRWVG